MAKTRTSPLNILFITTDQQRPDSVGWAADSRCETPQLDRLAEGTTFDACVTVNPVCMPARSALMTGRYAHQVGALSMSGDLSPQHPTFTQALQRAGYWTAGIGKFHLWQGWPWSAPRGLGHDMHRYKERMMAYGFDYLWESAGKQLALRNHCDYAVHLERQGLLEEYREWLVKCGRNTNYAESVAFTGDPFPFGEQNYIDHVTGAEVIKALDSRPTDKPFFLWASFCGPHAPFDPPASYLEKVPYEEVDDFIPGDKPLAPEIKKRLYRLRRAYKAMIHVIDDEVGRLFAYLEKNKLWDNTLIVFTSDHGEMLGDHARVQKNSFYHHSVGVPCAIRHPEHLNRQRSPHPIELTDLTATMLEAAGLDPQKALIKDWPYGHAQIPSRSLMPVLRGEKPRVRDYAYAECAFSEGQNETSWQMILSDDWKYIRHLGQADPDAPVEMLFDRRRDPQEQMNRAGDPALAEVLAWHRRRRDHTLDLTPPAQFLWAPRMMDEASAPTPTGNII